jgi:hypothetical protein
MLLSRLVAGTVSLPPDLPDFNSIISAPDSEDAYRAAAFLRANAIGEFGMLNIDRVGLADFGIAILSFLHVIFHHESATY